MSFSGKTTACLHLCVCCFPCASPHASTAVRAFTHGDYCCVSGQHSLQAVLAIREKREKEWLDLQKWHTTCTADVQRTDTSWSFRAKLAGQAQRSAQAVESIPLWEAADNLLRCVADQRERHMAGTYENLRVAVVDVVQMIAYVQTADLKQTGQWVCAVSIVSFLLVARGLAHDPVCLV